MTKQSYTHFFLLVIFMLSLGYSYGQTMLLSAADSSVLCGSETEVVELVSSATGRIWMDRNLGASRAATSGTDHLAYGCSYQWGRASDGHQFVSWTSSTEGAITNSVTTTLSPTDNPGHSDVIIHASYPNDWRTPTQQNHLWQGVSGTNNPCPSGYRIPTQAEWQAEAASFSPQNSEGAFTSLKLPRPGFKYNYNTADEFISVGEWGVYWSSTPGANVNMRCLAFASAILQPNADYRRVASRSVRCIKETSVACGSETEVVTVTSATGKTWMDRNLGASRAATSSTDYEAYGCHFQWGRAADGHQLVTWTSSTEGTYVNGTTSTNATSDTPGHSDFILEPLSPYDWRTPENLSLWQGVSGTNNPCPSGYRIPTQAEWMAEDAIFPTQDSAGAYNSVLKLPVAGRRLYNDGLLIDAGSRGLYWSSSLSGLRARSLYFINNNSEMVTSGNANGFSVRCVQD